MLVAACTASLPWQVWGRLPTPSTCKCSRIQCFFSDFQSYRREFQPNFGGGGKLQRENCRDSQLRSTASPSLSPPSVAPPAQLPQPWVSPPSHCQRRQLHEAAGSAARAAWRLQQSSEACETPQWPRRLLPAPDAPAAVLPAQVRSTVAWLVPVRCAARRPRCPSRCAAGRRP